MTKITKPDSLPPSKSSRQDIEGFLRQVATLPAVRGTGQSGRLIFAMDATASREPSWDQAAQIQGRMFEETAALGGLDVQLCYYRGFDEFEASPWYGSSRDLLARMSAVRCRAGQTQLEQVLRHALAETRRRRVQALVFVGDSMEENLDRLGSLAGQLGVLGVPLFLFHEGRDARAGRAFAELARLSGGAVCPFDAGSADQLRELLGAVAVYAAGGRQALRALGERRGGRTLQLLKQLQGD
ncbi:MAG: VWA domain-containing protein [Gammaproteobacteria bacterium]|nr:VWA domain-containing protein [Gammaproteobacteria bacterium]MCW9059066.1 VWA domain-containing protein [Gammaproteobacteria bacterium]